jgi:ABC-type bacteriocin/lantibiotic exporter with double-glycine peptidase domain
MKISPIKQRDNSACGPTVVQMVLNYFGVRHSFKEIAAESQYKKKDGLSNTDLVHTLKKFNLDVKEKASARWDDLVRYNTEKNVVVVSWMLDGYIGHFSVVERVGKSFIKLADPHTGTVIKMDKIMFMRLWMDYDDMWYPKKNTDIQLRWMSIVSKKKT